MPEAALDLSIDERVWAVAKLIPAGRVVSYGDIAALLAIGPRRVGRAMSQCADSQVPWWRVTNAAGRFPADLKDRALAHWRTEGTPVRADGSGVQMTHARADLAAWADVVVAAIGPVPGLDG